MRTTFVFFLLLIILSFVGSQNYNGQFKGKDIAAQTDTAFSIKDFDGNSYQVVTIGEQKWISSNLATSHYRNGKLIPEAKTIREWKNFCREKQGCWCYYNYDSVIGAKYGKLYNWYAVVDSVNRIAPKGFEVPSDKDFSILFINDVSQLKSTQGWLQYVSKNSYGKKIKLDGNGTNKSGFNALPGGFLISNGTFRNMGSESYWWTTTEIFYPYAGSYSISSNSYSLYMHQSSQWMGYYVRCLEE
ncbi:MAG TPA: fibrobacter succinogenes major paralogous domain-containing protein [Bacteroidia bacterium]|nr:fibrobacter succinogenes major paralogous domain-containing protein [Bacteroidia bacterium]